MSIKYIVAAVVIAAAVVAPAAAPQQAPPPTDVYLAPLTTTGGTTTIGEWTNVSASPEYDNQPSFLPDSTGLLFTSRRDGKQTDIYRYDIAAKKLSRVTSTPENEYSPTVTPDRKSFSVIRVESDNTTQRLWRFDLDGSNPRLVLENVKPVGYHAWIDDTHLALFILGAANASGSGSAPATLQLADTKTGLASVAATGIGRSIMVRPGTGIVTYVATGETPRVLKDVDIKTGATTTVMPILEGSQDCALMPSGRFLMARGNAIFSRARADTEWSTFADLGALAGTIGHVVLAGARIPPPSVKTITRLAVSPDGKWLAFVAELVIQ